MSKLIFGNYFCLSLHVSISKLLKWHRNIIWNCLGMLKWMRPQFVMTVMVSYEYNNTCQIPCIWWYPYPASRIRVVEKSHSKISCNIFPTLKSPWCMSLKKSLQSCKCTRLIYTGYQNSKVRQSSLKKNLFASFKFIFQDITKQFPNFIPNLPVRIISWYGVWFLPFLEWLFARKS